MRASGSRNLMRCLVRARSSRRVRRAAMTALRSSSNGTSASSATTALALNTSSYSRTTFPRNSNWLTLFHRSLSLLVQRLVEHAFDDVEFGLVAARIDEGVRVGADSLEFRA